MERIEGGGGIFEKARAGMIERGRGREREVGTGGGKERGKVERYHERGIGNDYYCCWKSKGEGGGERTRGRELAIEVVGKGRGGGKGGGGVVGVCALVHCASGWCWL